MRQPIRIRTGDSKAPDIVAPKLQTLEALTAHAAAVLHREYADRKIINTKNIITQNATIKPTDTVKIIEGGYGLESNGICTGLSISISGSNVTETNTFEVIR